MTATTKSDKATEILRCSFCNKDQSAVRYLIAGPSVFICDECVEVCGDIIKESQERAPSTGKAAAETAANAAPAVFCALCRMPVASTDALLIENRGILCRICVEAVEAAIVSTRESAT